MKRIVLSLALAMTLLVPATVRPPDVSAIDSCSTAADVGRGVLGVLTLGVSFAFVDYCDFGADTRGSGGCPITAVGADVRRDAQRNRTDVVDYVLADPCGNVRVTGSYAYKGEAQERLEGNGRTVKAQWYCSANPWTYTDQRPTCTRIAIAVEGTISNREVGQISQATYPISADMISEISRQTLNGQTQNALKRLDAPAPQPAPAPKPGGRVIRSTGSGPTSTAPSRFPFQTVGQGASGPNVEAIQYLLRAQGIDVTIDGDFGSQTREAVVEFQRRQGVTQDGVVRGVTAFQLLKTVNPGDAGDAVLAVQTLLNAKGEGVLVDGDYGSQTEEAVRQFQEDMDIEATGVVDSETWRALMAAD